MESFFGRDLGCVRVHEGEDAQKTARRFSARALAYGTNIVLGAGESTANRRLMAHELTHVMQQSAPWLRSRTTAPAPAFLPVPKDYSELSFYRKLQRIDSLLSYGIFDWEITDKEALEAMVILESMSPTERISAVSHVNLERLKDNLPGDEKRRLEKVVVETRGYTADRSQVKRVHSLLSYGVFDWKITDAEASKALDIFQRMHWKERMHALMGINLFRLMDNLPTEKQRQSLSDLWRNAKVDWKRSRQVRGSLNPADLIQVTVRTLPSMEKDDTFSGTYRVSSGYKIHLVQRLRIAVRDLRPVDIAKRIQDYLTRGYVKNPIVTVEVLRRSGETYKPREQPWEFGQPPDAAKLGPGDTFYLLVYDTIGKRKESELSQKYLIDKGGYIRVPFLGVVNVGGKTREEIVQYMRSLLRRRVLDLQVKVAVERYDNKFYTRPSYFEPKDLKKDSIYKHLVKTKQVYIRRRKPLDVYLNFVRQKQAEADAAGIDKRNAILIRRSLRFFLDWLASNNSEKQLSSTNPWTVWSKIHTPMWLANVRQQAERQIRERSFLRRASAREQAVKRKLDEFHRWATLQWRDAAQVFQKIGPLLETRSETYRISRFVMIDLVLKWAYNNLDSPNFLNTKPSDVTLILESRYPNLASLMDAGLMSPSTLEYHPDPRFMRPRQTLGQSAFEALIGILPGIGDVTDALAAITGRSITSYKLDAPDRFLMFLGAIVPLVPGSALRSSRSAARNIGEIESLATKISARTGRDSAEIEAILRLANNLDQTDVRQIDRIISVANSGRRLDATDLRILDSLANRLRGGVLQTAAAVSKRVVQKRRTGVFGDTLLAGTAAHKRQRWFEYQYRNRLKFRHGVDPTWSKLYDNIIANKRSGGAFEQSALQAYGYRKNHAMMMPPPGAGMKGFIPDSVGTNPRELVWRQAYHFREIKGWKDMSYTGNLKAMIQYVKKHGGHIEVVFQSRHPISGSRTTLSGPLGRELERLRRQGKATVKYYP